MKLYTKLKISFGVLILLPVLLLIIALASLTTVQVREINRNYNASDASYEVITNPVELVLGICESEYNKILDYSVNDTEKLQDEKTLDKLNWELGRRSAFLVMTRNGSSCFLGESIDERLLGILNDINPGNDPEASIYIGDGYQLVVNRIDFQYDNGDAGSAFIVMKIRELIPQMKRFIFECIIAVVIILVLTSGLFTGWIYRETVAPINKLRLATNNIKNGNLDFDIEVSGDNEIADLCRDFDEMKKRLKENAEEKLKYDADSKEMISNISHDLKTPITSIKGYVEGIMDGVADTPEKMDRYIKTIYNKACDMDRLINELTFYSKIDTNKVIYNFSVINVVDYFNDCVEELKIDLEAEGIVLGYHKYIDDRTCIVADAEQFKRVVNNIISNSVKYMENENGCIDLSITGKSDLVLIEITDNGKGISAKDLPYIFDRFYRTDASRNSAKGGSGIGLSIVKKIISDHGGRIWATSTEGEGTCMHIEIRKYVEQPKKKEALTN